MSQIDVNIIEPVPYIQIMQGVGPKGDKGDKGDTGEVTQVEFDELNEREERHYDELSFTTQQLALNKAAAEDVEDLKTKTNELLRSSIEIKSFEISVDGSTYSDEILIQNGSSVGIVYVKGEFSMALSVFTKEYAGGVTLAFGAGGAVLPLIEPMDFLTFSDRYIAPNVIRSNITATLSTSPNVPVTLEQKAYVRFVDRIHYGVAASGTLTDAFLLSTLSGHQLSKTKDISFTVNAGTGQYIWIALPVSYGTPKFTVGGFEGGFTSQGTFNHTNNLGYRTSYQVWKSDNKGLGNVTVVIS